MPSSDPSEPAHALGALSFPPHVLELSSSFSMALFPLAGAAPAPGRCRGRSLGPKPGRAIPGERLEPQGLGQELPFQLQSLEMRWCVCILMTRGFCPNCGPFVAHKAPGSARGSQHSTFNAFRTPNSADRGLSPALSPLKQPAGRFSCCPAPEFSLENKREGTLRAQPLGLPVEEPCPSPSWAPKGFRSFSLAGFDSKRSKSQSGAVKCSAPFLACRAGTSTGVSPMFVSQGGFKRLQVQHPPFLFI